MITIALGERNHEAPAPEDWPWTWDRMLERGAFAPSQRAKLARVGVQPDYWVNLLPPSLVSGGWRPDAARQLAAENLLSLPEVLGDRILLVCCGSRVAYCVHAAMRAARLVTLSDYPRTWCEALHVGAHVVTRVPHPSGRCRVWNSDVVIDELRERFTSLLTSLAQPSIVEQRT